MNPLKINFIHLLQLIASVEWQDKYQSEVNIDIADELICMWFDDFYNNDQRIKLITLLSVEELKRINEFHTFYEERVDCLPKQYEQLKESDLWHEIMLKAKETLMILNWDKIQTVWGFQAF